MFCRSENSALTTGMTTERSVMKTEDNDRNVI